MLRVAFFTLLLIIISGCSSTVYKPEALMGKKEIKPYAPKIERANHLKAITFKKGEVLMKQGLVKNIKLPDDYALINTYNEGYLAANLSGDVLILDKEGNKRGTLKNSRRVLSVSLEAGLIALVDATNTMKVYEQESKKLLFSFSGSEKSAVDMRLANPVFYQGMIFFPTFDGKIQLYSIAQNKMLRTISVSTEEKFNNIIFFSIEKGEKIFAATGTALYLFGKKSITKHLAISHVYMYDGFLYVLTKNGMIIKYDETLNKKASIKFQFARFLGALFKNSMIFVLENEGYVIKVYPDFENFLVYEVDFDHNMVFTGTDRFYFRNGYLSTP